MCAISQPLAEKIQFLAALGGEQVSYKEWRECSKRVRTELAYMCYDQRRILGPGEMSQVEWLTERGHAIWFVDKRRIRCAMNVVMDKYDAWFSEGLVVD